MTSNNAMAIMRRPKAPVACTACKSRKGRCSGSTPCDACISNGTPCVIDETLDGRRKVALNRRLEEVIHQKWILEGLLMSLRNCQGEILVRILELIHADAALPTIAHSVSEALFTIDDLADRYGRRDLILKGIQAYLEEQSQESESDPTEELRQTSNAQQHSANTPQRFDQYHSSTLAILGSPMAMSPQEAAHRRSSATPLPGSSFQQQLDAFDVQTFGLNHDPNEDCCLQNVVGWLKALNVRAYSGTASQSLPTFNDAQLQSIAKIEGQPTEDLVSTRLKTGQRLNNRMLIPKPSPSQLAIRQTKSVGIAQPASRSGTFSQHSTPGPAWLTPVTNPQVSSASHDIHTCTAGPELTHLLSSNASAYHSASSQPSMPPHMLLPNFKLGEHPIDRAIVSYLDLARSLISEGTPISTVFGPERPCFDLMFRSRTRSDDHSVCNFVAEVCGGIEGWEFPEKLGIAYMLIYTMRWMILPSKESYNKLHGMCKPTSTQLMIPHNTCVEICPFPSLRDSLCYNFRNYLTPMAQSISCNWPYGKELCLESDQVTKQIVLTETFRKHIMNPSVWTVHQQIFELFPECQGHIPTHFYGG